MEAKHIFHIGLAVTAILLGLKVGSRLIAMVQSNVVVQTAQPGPAIATGAPLPG